MSIPTHHTNIFYIGDVFDPLWMVFKKYIFKRDKYRTLKIEKVCYLGVGLLWLTRNFDRHQDIGNDDTTPVGYSPNSKKKSLGRT